jgi:hypothetical protein
MKGSHLAQPRAERTRAMKGELDDWHGAIVGTLKLRGAAAELFR